MSAGPALLLTRPEAQSRSFLKMCEARAGQSMAAVISPVLSIVPIEGQLDLTGTTLVVTSANAVRCLSGRLEGRRVATVGAVTAELARSMGAEADSLGETVEAFLERSSELQGPVVVARGVHARTDLARQLADRGLPSRAVTVYDQVANPLSDDALRLLAGAGPVVAPVFSPRSAALLSEAEITAPLTVVAISANAAEAWAGPGNIRVAAHPTAEAMCDLVAEVL